MTELPTFQAGEVITAEKLNTFIAAIKELQEAISGAASSQNSDHYEPPVNFDPTAFVAKIGAGTTAFQATEQVPTASGLEDFADSDRNCSDQTDSSKYIDINGWQNLPSDTKILALEMQESDAFRYRVVHVPPPPPVQDGSKSYILGYDGGTKQYKWYEQDDCT